MNLRPVILGLLVCTAAGASLAADSINDTARKLETTLDARIGVAVLDPASGRRWRHRGDERFPLTSTFKPLACAALLAKVDAGGERLDRGVFVDPDKLVTYSPVTETYAGREITLAEACEAAITLSDNTAGNLVLAAIDGPAGLTTFLRGLGDEVSRLDRIEPFLNEATPGDPRDTTTPEAIAETLMTLLSGEVLSEPSTALLRTWLIEDRVADALFRSRLPAEWEIGDKTGAGAYGSRGLIAFVRPPGRAPAFAAVYITETDAPFAERNEAIAEIGEAVFDALSAQVSMQEKQARLRQTP